MEREYLEGEAEGKGGGCGVGSSPEQLRGLSSPSRTDGGDLRTQRYICLHHQYPSMGDTFRAGWPLWGHQHGI